MSLAAAIAEAKTLLDREIEEIKPSMRRVLGIAKWRSALTQMAGTYGEAVVRLAVAVTLTDVLAAGGDEQTVREKIAVIGVEDYVTLRLAMQTLTGVTDVNNVILTRGIEFLSGRAGQTVH